MLKNIYVKYKIYVLNYLMTYFKLKCEKNTVWIIWREIVIKQLQPHIKHT